MRSAYCSCVLVLAVCVSSYGQSQEINGKTNPELISEVAALRTLFLMASDSRFAASHATRATLCQTEGVTVDEMEMVIEAANRFRVKYNALAKRAKPLKARKAPLAEYDVLNEELQRELATIHADLISSLEPDAYHRLQQCLEKTIKPGMRMTVTEPR